MKKYMKDLNFCFGFALIFSMVLLLILSFFWLPYNPEAMNVLEKLKTPNLSHWLGTDQFGRDILSRIMKGIQISFLIGVIVVLAGGAIGIGLGACSGYFGGKIDAAVMKLVDAEMAFPGTLLALMLIAVFGSGLENTILALVIMSVPRFVRMTRSGYMKFRNADFVRAEKVRGASSVRIMFLHILPNLVSELAATASLTFASAVMAEAGLSYLGFGVTPPDPSLGQLLQEAQGVIFKAPWYVLIPAAAITILVMGFNLLGDGIQHVNER